MPNMPNKDLYRLGDKLQVLTAEEAGESARPASLVRITRRTVGAEIPLHLTQPRVNRELRPGDVIVVERYRTPAYRDVAEAFPPLAEADAAAVAALLRLPDLDPAISAYLTQAPESSESDSTEKETADGEGQGASRKKRTKSGS